MFKRQSDDKDSTTSTWLNYFMAILVIGGIFIVEIFFSEKVQLLDGTLIGILIAKVFDAIQLQNAYFFPSQRPSKPNGADNAQSK